MKSTPDTEWAVKAEDLSLAFRVGRPWNKRRKIEVLKGLSFKVRPGENFGIMGRNGCGKSTLLRILAGVIRQDSGALHYQHIESKSLLSISLGFDMDLTGRDNSLLSLMLQGSSKTAALEKMDEIKEFSELGQYFEMPVRTYSTGMRSRLGFAVAIKANTDLLLIDEVLSVGDIHFRTKAESVMMEKLRGNQTIVFVSHSAQQVADLCQNAIWLDNGSIRAYGETAEVTAEYEAFMASLDTQ